MHFISPCRKKRNSQFSFLDFILFCILYVCFYTLFSHTQIILRAQGVPQPRRKLSNDSPKYEKAVNFNPASKG